jgi:hypothetical protein
MSVILNNGKYLNFSELTAITFSYYHDRLRTLRKALSQPQRSRRQGAQELAGAGGRGGAQRTLANHCSRMHAALCSASMYGWAENPIPDTRTRKTRARTRKVRTRKTRTLIRVPTHGTRN